MPIVVIGAGNLASGVPVVASFASYFGERPIDLRLWDPDLERLDLLDRLARVCFTVARSTHQLQALEDLQEACEDCVGAVLLLDDHGASRYRRLAGPAAGEGLREAVGHTLTALAREAVVMDLAGATDEASADRPRDWPQPLHPMALRVLPHQVLRWIRGDEYVTELLATHEESPLKEWLNALELATRD